MSQDERNVPRPAPSGQAGMKRQTRPASACCEQVEQCLAEISSQRRELRQQLAAQKEERRAGNPRAGPDPEIWVRLA